MTNPYDPRMQYQGQALAGQPVQRAPNPGGIHTLEGFAHIAEGLARIFIGSGDDEGEDQEAENEGGERRRRFSSFSSKRPNKPAGSCCRAKRPSKP